MLKHIQTPPVVVRTVLQERNYREEVSNDCYCQDDTHRNNRQIEEAAPIETKGVGLRSRQPPLRCATSSSPPSTSRIRVVHYRKGRGNSSHSRSNGVLSLFFFIFRRVTRSSSSNRVFGSTTTLLLFFYSIMTTMPTPVVSFSMTTTSAFRSSSTSSYVYPQQSEPEQPQNDRSAATTTTSVTTKQIMVVRILDQEEDSLNKRSIESKLQSVLFDGVDNGEGQILVSVKAQMSFCSQGLLSLEPSTYGIMTALIQPLSVDDYANLNAFKEAVLEAGARVALEQLNLYNADVGVSASSQIRRLADHVVMILPESYQNTDFLASADVGNTMSMFSVPWATSLSAFMHELAHNYGLTHSGLYSDVYGDITGYMGKSLPISWTPQKCYNAIQHWQLGWYQDHWAFLPSASSLEDQLPLRYEVAAFVDAKYTPLPVILKIDSVTALQYNRAKSYNQGTEMHPDRIVITRDIGGSTSLLAGLDPSNNPSYSFYTNDNQEITIYVCEAVSSSSSVDSMIIAIGMAADDSDPEVLCNAPMAPTSMSENAAPGDATESPPPQSQEAPPDQENNWNDGVLYGPPRNTGVPTPTPPSTTQQPEEQPTRTPETTFAPTSTQLRRTRAPASTPPQDPPNDDPTQDSNNGGSGNGETKNRPPTLAPTIAPPLQSAQDYSRISNHRTVIFASALVPVAVVVLFMAGFVFYRRRRKAKDQAHRLSDSECENDNERHNTHDDSTTTRESCGQQLAQQQQVAQSDNQLPTELVLDDRDWELPTNSLYNFERHHQYHNYNSDGCCDSSGSHSEYWTPEIRNAVALCLQEHEREAARQRYHRKHASHRKESHHSHSGR